jgi:hypothetical protein
MRNRGGCNIAMRVDGKSGFRLTIQLLRQHERRGILYYCFPMGTTISSWYVNFACFFLFFSCYFCINRTHFPCYFFSPPRPFLPSFPHNSIHFSVFPFETIFRRARSCMLVSPMQCRPCHIYVLFACVGSKPKSCRSMQAFRQITIHLSNSATHLPHRACHPISLTQPPISLTVPPHLPNSTTHLPHRATPSPSPCLPISLIQPPISLTVPPNLPNIANLLPDLATSL